jgi:hypothetical protein
MTALPETTIQGYLTEGRLAAALKELLADQWLGSQISLGGTRQRWDMSCRLEGVTAVVEYDGDEHYRHSIKIKADRAKDALALAAEYRVIRFPYWIQLDTMTLQHFFGISAIVHQSFPHGFITTKLFPASFCELGIARFRAELIALPEVVRDNVVKSLRERVSEHGLEYVLPSGLAHIID